MLRRIRAIEGIYTMQKTVLAAALAAFLGAGGAAHAADLNGGGWKDAPAYEANWTGAYLGISGGLALLTPKFSDSGEWICWSHQTCGDAQGIGGLIGGTLGYNWQIRNLVLGVEGDISWASLNAKSETYVNDPGWNSSMQSNIDAIATLRLRAGYATGSNLFYLTGGAAFVNAQHKAIYEDGGSCGTDGNTCSDSWRTGFAVGAGYEAMLTNNLSFKAEYLYIGMPTETLVNSGDDNYTYGFADNIQMARVGLNYKLSGGGYQPLK